MSPIEVLQADLQNQQHADAVVMLLDEYTQDPMGGGAPLSTFTRENIVTSLSAQAGVCVLLAFSDQQPVGLLIGFPGFSTFVCKPLLNIHDIVVSRFFRGRGIAQLLLQKAQDIAETRGCCKLTLEVLEGNTRAQAVYRTFGFAGYALDPDMGNALFWQKKL